MNREPRVSLKRFKVVLIEHQQDSWCSAQCLEWDIAVQAQGVEKTLLELHRVLKGHIAISEKMNIPPFKKLPKAPKKFWDLFEKSNVQATIRTGPASTRQSTRQKPHAQISPALDYDVHFASSDAQLV